jgi:hypothetical protein
MRESHQWSTLAPLPYLVEEVLAIDQLIVKSFFLLNRYDLRLKVQFLDLALFNRQLRLIYLALYVQNLAATLWFALL